MSQYILDTDHISLILRNHPQVIANASRHSISVTIIENLGLKPRRFTAALLLNMSIVYEICVRM